MKYQNTKYKIQNTKNSKGITLIALIITIIVLLIIAVVAIGAVQDSDIIAHAENSAKEYNAAKGEEESKILGYESFIESKIPGGENPPSQETVMPVATVGTIVTQNSTINGEMYSSTNPIIPAGFKAINTTTSKWDAVGGPEVDNGLVIQDESGNEFVWVPVTDDISTTEYISETNYREPDVVTGVMPSDTVDSASGIYFDAELSNLQKAGCTEDLNDDGAVNAYDFKIQLTNEYKSMTGSVNKYNGFYIGRFETSRNGVNPQSKKSSAASGSGQEIITAYNSSTENDWYGLYALNKKYKTSSVTGSMIWGIQYDKMMSWMGDAANTTIGDNRNKERTCGTAENDVIKNVYDLYGNSMEWILEAYNTNGRSVRGGFYYAESYSPSSRNGGFVPTQKNSFGGSRIALYVM